MRNAVAELGHGSVGLEYPWMWLLRIEYNGNVRCLSGNMTCLIHGKLLSNATDSSLLDKIGSCYPLLSILIVHSTIKKSLLLALRFPYLHACIEEPERSSSIYSSVNSWTSAWFKEANKGSWCSACLCFQQTNEETGLRSKSSRLETIWLGT